MPWYMDPERTCEVLNRIANHNSYKNLKDILDKCMNNLWKKQEGFRL